MKALDKPIPARGALGQWDYEIEDPRGGENRG